MESLIRLHRWNERLQVEAARCDGQFGRNDGNPKSAKDQRCGKDGQTGGLMLPELSVMEQSAHRSEHLLRKCRRHSSLF
jgi:hypothetical protein